MPLLQIRRSPTPETSVIQLSPGDNVAIARVPLAAGALIRTAARELRTTESIPEGHKMAVQDIAPGESIVRYGSPIGLARVAIRAGEHVHTHNLAFEDREDCSLACARGAETPGDLPSPDREGVGPTFLGYPRRDGRAGTRNYIAVAAASNCSSYTAELIAARFPREALPAEVDGVVAFPHGEGCGHSIGPDTRQLQRVIAGVMDHPNVAASVLLGLGCEMNSVDNYGSRVSLTLQSAGGTRATVEAGVREVGKLIEKASAERVPVPASKLVLGLNCGGSDSFSGISANPALGVCSDMLARIGATAVLAETTELFGAERLLLERAASLEVAQKLLGFVSSYKRYLSQFGGSFDDNPSPGNKQGGLTNIVEKSLGAVAKSGSSPLRDVVDYAERIHSPGLVFMNTPGYDPVSLTGLAAGGVNLIAFTTGRGSAIGFPTVPVLKIATNTGMFEAMRDNMDLNAGRIIDGEMSIEQMGEEIFARLLAVASGERTASEKLGHHEFVPWRIGPVL
jgi:altronate hydrolase